MVVWFKLHIVFMPLFMVASLIVPYDILVKILVPAGAVSCGVGLMAGIMAWHEGRPSTSTYTIAWALLFAGGFILALSKQGIIAQTLVTNYALQIGSVVETVLLSFALAQRINSEKLLRLDAQNEVLELQVKANVELEKRVAERTQELNNANEKLKEISDTDKLSGLKNRRYFDAFLEKEFARGFREKYFIGILMVDIDRFKSINDTYGHTVGDMCIQATAKVLLDSIRRPADVLVRYGGEEFCIVLPRTHADGALHVANRCMAAVRGINFPVKDQFINITCSIGYNTDVPVDPKRTKEFIDRADSALYEAKNTGRDKVVAYSDSLENK